MHPSHMAAGLAMLLASGLAAQAGEVEGQPPLPGVEGNYSIVAPAPEPIERPEEPKSSFKAGNWEVTVSGYVWVQVGASSAGDGR